MKELIVAYGVKNIYSKYNNYGDYTKIIIPATVDKISDAFNNLTYLEEVLFESYIDKDGKIVGAITHTILDNPKKGFGISIEKMLESVK